MSSDRLLTVGEVQERLNLSRMMVYRLMDSGELASMKIGRARRIPESAVAAFIAEHTTSGSAA